MTVLSNVLCELEREFCGPLTVHHTVPRLCQPSNRIKADDPFCFVVHGAPSAALRLLPQPFQRVESFLRSKCLQVLLYTIQSTQVWSSTHSRHPLTPAGRPHILNLLGLPMTGTTLTRNGLLLTVRSRNTVEDVTTMSTSAQAQSGVIRILALLPVNCYRRIS